VTFMSLSALKAGVMAIMVGLPAVETFMSPCAFCHPCRLVRPCSACDVSGSFSPIPGWSSGGVAPALVSDRFAMAGRGRIGQTVLRAKKRGSSRASRSTSPRRPKDEADEDEEEIETYATCPMCSSDNFRKLEAAELATDVKVRCDNCGNVFNVAPEKWKNIADIYKDDKTTSGNVTEVGRCLLMNSHCADICCRKLFSRCLAKRSRSFIQT